VLLVVQYRCLPKIIVRIWTATSDSKRVCIIYKPTISEDMEKYNNGST